VNELPQNGSYVTSGLPALEFHTKDHVVRIVSNEMDNWLGGSYSILVYDADGESFVAGVVRERGGEVSKAWVHPLTDGKGLDIRIWTTGSGSGMYGQLDWLRLVGKAFQEIALPDPAPALLQGHNGHDSFDIVDGVIHWEFPIYKPSDPNADPTGGYRTLILSPADKKWKLLEQRQSQPSPQP